MECGRIRHTSVFDCVVSTHQSSANLLHSRPGRGTFSRIFRSLFPIWVSLVLRVARVQRGCKLAVFERSPTAVVSTRHTAAEVQDVGDEILGLIAAKKALDAVEVDALTFLGKFPEKDQHDNK